MLLALETHGFRNLEPLRWQPAPGCHLLLGGNGAGKTSLLEAIYVVATTRSFRTANLADCCRHGERSFRLAAEASMAARTRLELAWSGNGRQRSVNGNDTRLADHLAVLPVVSWTSRDSEMLTGPPGLRRRFIDRGVVGLRPASLDILAQYRRALMQKRHLLVSGGAGLESWNAVLADSAASLAVRRHDYVERLDRTLTALLADSDLAIPPIQLVYRPSPKLALEGAGAINEAFSRLEPEERRRRMPLVGPQRDDLEIRWGGHSVRRVASAGERKALALAILAAHGRVLAAADRRPVYLLDDADTELARDTLSSVWNLFVSELGDDSDRQLFATSNRSDIWTDLRLDQHWRVERGSVRQR